MKTLRALRTHPYGHAQRRAGAVYEAPDAHAALLVAAGQAEMIELRPTMRTAPPADPPRDETAGQNEETEPGTPKRKRRYQRRDLQSEE